MCWFEKSSQNNLVIVRQFNRLSPNQNGLSTFLVYFVYHNSYHIWILIIAVYMIIIYSCYDVSSKIFFNVVKGNIEGEINTYFNVYFDKYKCYIIS